MIFIKDTPNKSRQSLEVCSPLKGVCTREVEKGRKREGRVELMG